MAREGAYDVLVVDRMLPKLDSLSLIRSLREQGMDTRRCSPALGQVDGAGVKGLRARGDGELSKPYAFSEPPCPRPRCWCAAAPRPADRAPTAYRVADLRARPAVTSGHAQWRRDRASAARIEPARVPDEERQPVVTRTMLLEHVLEYHFQPQTNVIERACLAAEIESRRGVRPVRSSHTPVGAGSYFRRQCRGRVPEASAMTALGNPPSGASPAKSR